MGDDSSAQETCALPPLSAVNGVAWGAVRLPPAMRRARGCFGVAPWQWYVLLHQRSPGDTLVSEYHSFGWSHPPAPKATAEQKAAHHARQARIRNTTVAQYVAEHMPELRKKYMPYLELIDEAATGTGLSSAQGQRGGAGGGVTIVRSRYEEMVTDFSAWLEPILAQLAVSYTPQTLAILREALLMRHASSFKSDGKHRRSIVPGRYEAEVDALARGEHQRVHNEWWHQLGY